MDNATMLMDRMIEYGIAHGLLAAQDRAFARNLLLDAMKLDAPEDTTPSDAPLPATLTPMLDGLCDIAAARGLVEDTADAKGRFADRLAGLITPAPAAIRLAFWGLREAQDSRAATDWFYQLCRACNYIKVDHIAKNARFEQPSDYGDLEITINLSKPEKDPRDIIAQKNAPQLSYPRCMLCVENPGYAGRAGFPARQNHRMIPLTLNGKPWHLQYSPYLYYNEHCIVLNEQHVPMHIDAENLSNMFDFVDQFPHYFIGSNADLPIVGGSILSHDHFQGGRHIFPMDKAETLISLRSPAEGVQAEIARWPMSCVRLHGKDRDQLIEMAAQMLSAWRAYSDESLGILAHTDAPHNTITPIVRREQDQYTLSLVLRNNRTSDEHPLGIFHPHADLHHVKKENIGLIEVMGLFILPGRLLDELQMLEGYLTGEKDIAQVPATDDPIYKHYEWVQQIAKSAGTDLDQPRAQQTIRDALTAKCQRVLEDAGVFKLDESGQAGMLRFLNTLGYEKR
ncbi:UDP-glucose--hexose-1-phosphate uridylyltransferase [Eubacteriales bacterium OttesenSCG-928-N13]|nr:UDP-glucose--hexose-1-phosphate uridylyltransferase [Eubacteriales bacterium OttesenSCG-928-N13]